MTRIAVISDTHGLLRPEVIEELKKADYIIHAGDINTKGLVDQMKEYAPLTIVRGNNDKEWAEFLPQTKAVTIDGIRFFVIHNKKEVPKDLPVCDVLIFGHSHKYHNEVADGIRWLNPGSCGKRRFDQEITMCRILIEDGAYQIEKIMIPT